MLQVADRHIWRSALENGRYELLSEENKENGIIKTVNENVEEVEIDEQAKVIVKDRYKMSFLKEPSLFPATLIVNFPDVNVSSSKKIILKSYHEGFNIYNY